MTGPILRTSNLNFFLERVKQSRAEGEEATLAHVRDRCRRSEAAWQALADKARRSERLKEAEAKRKAGQALYS